MDRIYSYRRACRRNLHSLAAQLTAQYAALFTALLLAVFAAAPAAAQSMPGTFIDWQTPQLGGVATNPTAPGGFTITAGGVMYNLDAQAPQLSNQDEYTLSPSGDYLFVLEDNTAGISNSVVYFAQLDGMGGVTLLHTQVISGSMPNARRLQGPFYFDRPVPFEQQKIAVMILGQPNGSEIWAQVFDLNTPGISGSVRVNLEAGLDGFGGDFAPSGTHLVIKNGLNDFDTQNVLYTLIDLCGASGPFGTASDIVVSGSLIPPDPVFEVGSVTGGMIELLGQIPGQAGFVLASMVPDCLDPVVEPMMGACCTTLAGNVFCQDGVTAAECTGDFFANMTCDEACPTASLSITASGPSSVVTPNEFTYTLIVNNSGSADATNTIISAPVPLRTSFVSADRGGFEQFGTVTWQVGTVAAGTAETVRFTVSTNCSSAGATATLARYSTRAVGTPLIFGSLVVMTDLVAPSADPIDVSVGSVPVNGAPARQGDTITHTIRLSNPNASPAVDVQIPGGTGEVRYGQNTIFGNLVSDGGGMFTQGNFGFSWAGDVPAMGSVEIVFTTVIDCVEAKDPNSPPRTVTLNNGTDINARTLCSAILGTATPSPIEVATPLEVTLQALEVVPGTFGPADSGGFGASQTRPVRPETEIEFVLSATNTQGMDLPDVTLEQALGITYVAANPPFVGTPPAGTTYDPTTNTVMFRGPLADGATIEIRFRARIAADQCRAFGSATASASMGCTGFVGSDAFFVVPEPPAAPHLYGSDGFDGILRYELIQGGGVDRQRVTCITPEIYNGLTQTSDGTLFMGGLPSLLINPETLNFGFLGSNEIIPAFAGLPGAPTSFTGNVIGLDPTADAALYYQSINRRGGDSSESIVQAFTDQTFQVAFLNEIDGFSLFTNAPAAVTTGGQLYIPQRDGQYGVLDLSGTLPLGAGDVTSMPAPEVVYPYADQLGTFLTTRGVESIGPDGDDVLMMVRTSIFSSSNEGSNLYAVVRVSGTDGSVTVIEPEYRIFQTSGAPAVPPEASFLTTGFLSRPDLEIRPDGQIWISTDAGAALFDPAQRTFTAGVSSSNGPLSGLVAVSPPVSTGCNPADLFPIDAGDSLLNSDDVLQFVNFFNAMDLRADLFPIGAGDSLLNSDDVLQFVNDFNAGCP